MGIAPISAAIVLAAGVAVGATAARQSPAAAPRLLSASGTATIDGRFSAGEWAGAARVEFAVKKPPGSGGATAPATLSVMNDSANLYLGYQVADVSSITHGLTLNFDGDGDRVLSEGDQTLLVYSWQGSLQTYIDEYFSERPPCPAGARCLGIEDFQTGGSTDGSAAVSRDGSSTTFEISLPLNDGDDAHDLNLGAGDLVALDPSSELSTFDASGTGYTQLPGAPIMIVIAPYVSPTLTWVEPAHGVAGTHVTLTGAHLAGVSAVTFAGGKQATFELAPNSRTIDAIVPRGAVSGPIAVTTPGGTGMSAKAFTVDVVRPAIGRPTAAPPILVAGKPATIRFTVTPGSAVHCDLAIAGARVAHRDRVAKGWASVQLRVPPSAKGKTLVLQVSAALGAATATRTARFLIR